jgi:hypothetical protein
MSTVRPQVDTGNVEFEVEPNTMSHDQLQVSMLSKGVTHQNERLGDTRDGLVFGRMQREADQ